MDEELLDISLTQQQILNIINTFLVGSLMMGSFSVAKKDNGGYDITFSGKMRQNEYTNAIARRMAEAEKKK